MEQTNNRDYEDDLLEDIQKYKHQEMFEKADNIVLGFAASAGATGAIPIPFADAPLLISQQVAMMLAINYVFDFDIERDTLASLVTAVIGVGGATVIGKTIVSNLLKCIPGVGSVAGGAISAGTAGIITLALGKAYIEVCKAIEMGNLSQDDLTKKAGIDTLKKSFKEQLKQNKEKDKRGFEQVHADFDVVKTTKELEAMAEDTEDGIQTLRHYASTGGLDE